MARKKPVIIVGTKGYWNVRDIVDREVFSGRFELVYSESFNVSAEIKKRTVALVIADQKCGTDLMDSFPNLATIARTGTGYDNIDIPAARERNIVASRVANINAEPTSEFALCLMLALSRNIVRFHGEMLSEKWERKGGLTLSEKTVGIVGLGAVGRTLAGKLHALHVKRLIGWNRSINAKVLKVVQDYSLEIQSLRDVMSESDTIVISLALTAETAKLIDKNLLALMKRDAHLINVARGAIVDEEALAECVEEDRIGGVALDVYSVEPPMAHPFKESFMQKLIASGKSGKNIILSPHSAFYTANSVKTTSLHVARNIVAVLDGRPEDAETI